MAWGTRQRSNKPTNAVRDDVKTSMAPHLGLTEAPMPIAASKSVLKTGHLVVEEK